MVGAVVDQMGDDLQARALLGFAGHVVVGQRGQQLDIDQPFQVVAPGGHAGFQVVLQCGALGYRFGIQAGERLRFVAHPRQPDAIGHRQVVEGGVDAAEEQPAGRAVLRFVQARQLAEQARVSPAVIGQQALQVSGEVLHQASARRP